MRRECDILENAVRSVAEQAAKADELVDEAIATGLDGSHPLTVHAKMLRLELLKMKAELEHELERLILDCAACGQTVHWVAGVRPDVVSRALGHASTGFTLDVYVHPSGEEQLAAADVMGAAFEEATGGDR